MKRNMRKLNFIKSMIFDVIVGVGCLNEQNL